MSDLERLLIDVKESLEREIRGGFSEMRTRFDNPTRPDRRVGMLHTGSRWSARMNEWAERVDAALEAQDREIAELRERISRLERKSG